MQLTNRFIRNNTMRENNLEVISQDMPFTYLGRSLSFLTEVSGESIMQKEKWLPVVGYEGRYSVSDKGRIKSHVRHRCIKEKILILCSDKNGYSLVSLYKNGKMRNGKVHALVAESFIGSRPKGLVVDHKDNNPKNNNVENLSYITVRENNIRGKNCMLKANSTSKFIGVHFCKVMDMWRSRKVFNKKNYCLGYFCNEEHAAIAYENATEDSCKQMMIDKEIKRNLKRGVDKWCNTLDGEFSSDFTVEGE